MPPGNLPLVGDGSAHSQHAHMAHHPADKPPPPRRSRCECAGGTWAQAGTAPATSGTGLEGASQLSTCARTHCTWQATQVIAVAPPDQSSSALRSPCMAADTTTVLQKPAEQNGPWCELLPLPTLCPASRLCALESTGASDVHAAGWPRICLIRLTSARWNA